jgi:transposase
LHFHTPHHLRIFIEGVWFILRTGMQWRHLPVHYRSWSSVHRKFKRWSDRGIWEDLFRAVQSEPDLENIMIDSTIIRAHACAAGLTKESQSSEALGRSKGGFTTKIHAVVDGLGVSSLPVVVCVTVKERGSYYGTDFTQTRHDNAHYPS